MCGKPTTENSDIVSTETFRLFREYRQREFMFVESGGNFGDYLIWKGAKKVAQVAGINFQSVNYDEFMDLNLSSEYVVYIHGGGGFVPWWSGTPMKALKKAVNRHHGITIVGPQTFSTDRQFLKREIVDILENCRSKKIFIFARDPISYSALKECMPSWVNLDLDHDTALNLSSKDLGINPGSSGYTLCSIREDKEAYSIKKKEYFSVWVDPVKYCKSFEEWVKIHAHAKKIVTNRLHSAIAGTILGKETVLLPNNYHKNRAVWQFSLRSRDVTWKEELPICSLSRLVEFIPPMKAIAKRSKFQTLIRKIYGIRH